MGSIKTAISIRKPLFEQIESLANEMHVSRSHLFAIAAQEFLERHRSRKLLESINDAYDDMPTAEEEELLAGMRGRHSEVVNEQW